MSGSARWQHLGNCAPTNLVDARLQVHWAAQLLSAVGTTLLPPVPDDSHTNLEWLFESGRLAGRLTPDPPRCRAALRPADLALHVLDEQNVGIAEHRLHGLTFSQGMVWLEQEIAAFTQRSLPKPLRRRELELPDHPVAHGKAFSIADGAAFAELGRWYANADGVLRGLAERTRNASPVRCWPHHFDIATLVTLDSGTDREHPRTIGIGMSPGDASYAEPYWYVTPWPYPQKPRLPALNGDGEWHQTGWFGALLSGSKLTAAGSAPTQARRVDAFLRSAVEACRVYAMAQCPSMERGDHA